MTLVLLVTVFCGCFSAASMNANNQVFYLKNNWAPSAAGAGAADPAHPFWHPPYPTRFSMNHWGSQVTAKQNIESPDSETGGGGGGGYRPPIIMDDWSSTMLRQPPPPIPHDTAEGMYWPNPQHWNFSTRFSPNQVYSSSAWTTPMPHIYYPAVYNTRKPSSDKQQQEEHDNNNAQHQSVNNSSSQTQKPAWHFSTRFSPDQWFRLHGQSNPVNQQEQPTGAASIGAGYYPINNRYPEATRPPPVYRPYVTVDRFNNQNWNFSTRFSPYRFSHVVRAGGHHHNAYQFSQLMMPWQYVLKSSSSNSATTKASASGSQTGNNAASIQPTATVAPTIVPHVSEQVANKNATITGGDASLTESEMGSFRPSLFPNVFSQGSDSSASNGPSMSAGNTNTNSLPPVPPAPVLAPIPPIGNPNTNPVPLGGSVNINTNPGNANANPAVPLSGVNINVNVGVLPPQPPPAVAISPPPPLPLLSANTNSSSQQQSPPAAWNNDAVSFGPLPSWPPRTTPISLASSDAASPATTQQQSEMATHTAQSGSSVTNAPFPTPETMPWWQWWSKTNSPGKNSTATTLQATRSTTLLSTITSTASLSTTSQTTVAAATTTTAKMTTTTTVGSTTTTSSASVATMSQATASQPASVPPFPFTTGVVKTTPPPPPAVPGAIECGKNVYMQNETLYAAASQGIVGGMEARLNEFPWQVRINYRNAFVCGGAVISTRHILTAAHCIIGPAANYQVVLGDHIRNEHDKGEVTLNIVKITVHPGYSDATNQFDLAVMHTLGEIAFDNNNAAVRPVCLPEGAALPSGSLDALAGKQTIVTGWGKMKESGSAAPVLQKGVVPILPQAECIKDYRTAKFTEDMMCAGYKSGVIDTCQGDSGGPMVLLSQGRFYIQGVTSWGYGCARPDYPGVYARVAPALDWIRKAMNDQRR